MINMKYAYEMSHVMQDVIVIATMQTSQEDKMAGAACLSVYVVIRMCVHCC